MRFYDLNVPTEDSPSEPLPQVRHQNHQESAAAVAQFFNCKIQDLPGGMGWGNDSIELITHGGTHRGTIFRP